MCALVELMVELNGKLRRRRSVGSFRYIQKRQKQSEQVINSG